MSQRYGISTVVGGTVLGGVVIAVLWFFTVTMSGGIAKPPDIIVHVNNSGTNASITTTGSAKCKVVNQGNGCIHIDQDDKGLITFRLKGPPSRTFKTLEICKVLDDGSKVCDLNIWERMEFAATIDSPGAIALMPSADGRVNLAGLSVPSPQEFLLIDQNRIKQEYYYRVEACVGSDCAWADPPLENGGTK